MAESHNSEGASRQRFKRGAFAKFLARNALVTRRDAEEAGFMRSAVDTALKHKMVVPTWREGVFVRSDQEHNGWIDFALVAKVTGGVIWGASAGMFHDLTDDIPNFIHVVTPRNDRSTFDWPNVESTRTRVDDNLTLGVETFDDNGLSFRVTGMARTVVDLLRLKESRQHVAEAVRAFCAAPGDTAQLTKIAERFGVGEEIGIMVGSTLVAFDRIPLR